MSSRAKEHEAWNLDHNLTAGEHLPLVCPRCARPHVETLTNDPSQLDYLHHVHQCTYCGLRFDLFVRTRSTGDLTLPKELAKRHPAISSPPRWTFRETLEQAHVLYMMLLQYADEDDLQAKQFWASHAETVRSVLDTIELCEPCEQKGLRP